MKLLPSHDCTRNFVLLQLQYTSLVADCQAVGNVAVSPIRHPPLLKVLLPLIVLIAVIAGGFLEVRQAHAAVQATFYVSPSGSDSNAGSLAAPFQTLAKAQSVVRTIDTNMTGDIYVYLRGGTYPISSAVAFAPQDSGTIGHTIYYEAYPGETPVLSAGTTVTGWTQYSGSIYEAHLSRTTCAGYFAHKLSIGE